MLKTNRKAKIFLINIITAVICAYIINDTGKYKDFLDFVLYLSIAFFASNTLGKFKTKNEEPNS